jgi:phosphoribosylamine--glycine ligase
MKGADDVMKVLIVGAGGREHALAWAMRTSPAVDLVFIAPGNPGTARVGTNLPEVRTNDCDAMIRAARNHAIDLTVVGPESPLAQGMADRFREAGLKVFGPSAAAARLEGSKVFSKEFMARHGIPTAPFLVFDNAAAAHRHVDRTAPPIVLKADGLASGKGVTVAGSREEAHAAVVQVMEKRIFGAAGDRVIIEEYMAGEEASLFVVSDGVHHLPFVAAQDHKRAFDRDRGPNTGGMGAYAPAAIITRPLLAEINERIVTPALQGMAQEGAPYTGLLYVGLMISPLGPRVVEFNCRFGDPETQALLPLLETDLFEVLESAASGRLSATPLAWKSGSSVTVVMASHGYPGEYQVGHEIEGIEKAEEEGALVFHAGTALREGRLVTNGGRVLNVTVEAMTLGVAIERAYGAAARIHFKGAHYRRDIGDRALGEGAH